ncbi:MAG: DJ-1/PfpI family protein [Cyclobacteriaceae bacterium]
MRSLIVVLTLMGLISCSNDKKQQRTQTIPVLPTHELNAAFVIVEGVYNSELIAPMDVLHHTKFHTKPFIKVFTVAPSKDMITTFEGLRLSPDYAFNEEIPRVDILIVPSAEHSIDTDLQNEELIAFVKNAAKGSSYIMSLCDGAFVLAHAGLLDTYQCTTFPGDVGRFREMFPQLTVHEGVSFVHDRKAITSAGGAKSYDPALFLVEHLYGKEVADGIAKGLVIDWDLAGVSHVEANR